MSPSLSALSLFMPGELALKVSSFMGYGSDLISKNIQYIYISRKLLVKDRVQSGLRMHT
jgi:hypothetical protein